MKKKGLLIASVLLIYLIGVTIMLYPIISSMWAKQHQMTVVENYMTTVNESDQADIDSELAAINKYNSSLLENSVVLSDPFDPYAPDFPDGEYGELLDFTEAMAYIEIPKLDLSLPVYHGTERETLSKGVGHLEGTSLPVGGVGTHSVLSAHSGLPTVELFTNLEKLDIGDLFYIHVLNMDLAYQVDEINVVEPSDISLLKIDENADYITLLTCTPYGVNSHRLLVRGTRVDYTAEETPVTMQSLMQMGLSPVEIVQLTAIVMGVLLFAVIIVLLFKPKRRRGIRRK